MTILKKLIVGPLGTNSYIFGNDKTKEVVIIDPGAEANTIMNAIENLEVKPIAVLLTHGHFDHTTKVKKILREYEIPLMFSKKEYDSGVYPRKEADRWLEEGDIVEIGETELHVLETPGHSPGSLSYYTKDAGNVNGGVYEGIIFTGDLLFRRSIGRSDVPGGDQRQLFASIKNKIMNNPELSDNFLVLPGHMGNTTIGEERRQNLFRKYFL